MSNRAFGDADFIDASRQFVCVRPESYESLEVQTKMRKLLGGNFENTAFCILSPDGEKQLSKSGRGVTGDVKNAQGLDLFALQYRPKGEPNDALTPDFNSFRMALNIASADSRVLVLIAASKSETAAVEKRMRAVAWHDDVVGRFHYDFESDLDVLQKPLSLSASSKTHSIYLIRPGDFGVSGKVMKQLPLDSEPKRILGAMKQVNAQYAKTTKRKMYGEHVGIGHRQGYFFEMPMPFGEDRDADGTPDANSSGRYESAKRRSLKTGNYFPVQ